jgi:hypothetical protein
LKMVPIGCPETALRNNPEEHIFHLLRGGKLKSSIALSSSCPTVLLDVRELKAASFIPYRHHYFSNLH